MNNQFIKLFFFALLISLSTNRAHAQNAEPKENNVVVNNSFIGIWKDAQDPHQLLEIYKDGAYTIVCKRSDRNDRKNGFKKYTVISAKGNRILVDYEFGATPLTLTDDGPKIHFNGQEYVKN